MWTGFDFATQLLDQLRDRPDLTGLAPPLMIRMGDVPLDEPASDILAVLRIRDTHEYATLRRSGEQGATTDEDVTVSMMCWIWRPGAGEAAAAPAWQRLELVLSEVHRQVADAPPQVGVQTLGRPRVTNHDALVRPYTAGAAAGMLAVCEFDVAYEARIP